MPDNAPLTPIDVRDLVYANHGAPLLSIPKLTIEEGAPTVILGPNGAGKSLLLRLLHGLLRPTRGSITFGGHAPDMAIRRRQAMMLQRPVLLRRSVYANIDFVLRLSGVPRHRRAARVAEILNRARLTDKATQSARTLSGGEAQRLAMIRALTLRPDILFLDEPTSSLDPEATRSIEQMVLEAAAQGTKIVTVTHDFGQAKRLAGDVVFCHGGRVVEHARAERFFDAPASTYARQFLKGELVL